MEIVLPWFYCHIHEMKILLPTKPSWIKGISQNTYETLKDNTPEWLGFSKNSPISKYYIEGDDMPFEGYPLKILSEEGQLMAY